MGSTMFARLREHIEDSTDGEQGAFIFCGYAEAGPREVLIAREWRAIPDGASRGERVGLEWTSAFSSQILQHALSLKSAIVLIHSHGATKEPDLSGPDKSSAGRLFPGFSRITNKPCGSIVLGNQTATGIFWKSGREYADLTEIRVVALPLEHWRPRSIAPTLAPKRRHNRLGLAIGPTAATRLSSGAVGVIGLCGGGSHVCQQLAHIGVGRIVAVDNDVVEDINLDRMVGSTPEDVDKTLKCDVMKRLGLTP
jgi:hypothetical protein